MTKQYALSLCVLSPTTTMSNPKKDYGTTRVLGVPNKDVSKGAEAYRKETLRNNFNPKLSAFFQKSGGYVAWLAGHQHPEQGRANPEYDFARYLAKKGHYMELLPEREGYQDAISLNEVGQSRKFVDASATSSIKKVYYEQWSPTSGNQKHGILQGLQHTAEKNCRILCINDYKGVLSRELIKKGMNEYKEKLDRGVKGYIKIDYIVTKDKNGVFHTWYWE